jgi:hypothetical protein
LIGKTEPVEILMDHKPLTHLTEQSQLNQRQSRWINTLADFNLKFVYNKGVDNVVADALSRVDSTEEKKLTTKKEITESLNTIQSSVVDYSGDPKSVKDFSITDGMLLFKGKICVPREERLTLIRHAHDSPLAAHPGKNKTLACIQRNYYWPGMSEMVHEYVQHCDVCQRTKVDHRKPLGMLHPLQIPKQQWLSISMDWITHLPKTAHGHDACLVVVDRFSKYTTLIPTSEHSTAEDTIYELRQHVFSRHGYPQEIISDRDTRINAKVMQEWLAEKGIKSRMSTARHPQTDGQTERHNQTVEGMLRANLQGQPFEWDLEVPDVEFAMNNGVHSATGFAPFEVDTGRIPNQPPSSIPKFEQITHPVTRIQRTIWRKQLLRCQNKQINIVVLINST